ncbi:MAG TPA: RHS repeat-associated core domain-containing protein [Chitinophaga sp.]|uniref:RHS repeat domain-containing protein n=1 Tax=Chitinophaga sp. TaxID=1869181 RepID=UPI002C1975FB|nr:RHS repeat-associated core domain-containing protein [Chitinophaga sp.]HVI47121.1 RHS repeat-associated core domain-containing protein [Chitinophaga sp.]
MYYSPNNPEKLNDFQSFIPDAQGYPLTETSYTPDNTGRISRVGGVGSGYQLGSGHETKYYYGSPSQEELDALFGTEVGDKSHYFKNMVRDPNGQYSVSYLDMHGRTIATAMAGTPDNTGIQKLPSNKTLPVIDTLSSQGSNIIKELVMESKQSQLVAAEGDYQFSYLVTPPVLQRKDCNNNNICYAGLYDLEIKITDDCNNQKLGGTPYISRLRNYDLSGIVPDCNPKPVELKFSLRLPPGNYEITKRLLVGKEGMDYYRDNVFLKSNSCRTLQQFINEQQALITTQNKPCIPDCKTCLDSVGTWNGFKDRYIRKAGIPVADAMLYNGQIMAAYQAAMDACNALCNKQTESDDIQKAMLLDVSAPSGQYANLDDISSNKYSIFYQPDENTLPSYRNSSIIYLDENRNADKVYNEVTGTYVSPQALSPSQFAAKFKLSWAAALLPLHPEYCKLKEYQKHTASHTWDRIVGMIDSYDEAKQKGYLNPTSSAIAPAGLPSVTGGQDPLSQESATLKSQLESRLSKYSGNYSMWAVATLMSKCNQPDITACAAIYGTAPFDETKLCKGELDMAWRNFRELYLNVKRDIISNLVKQAACASAAELIAAGKQPNFNNAVDALNQNGLGYLNDPALTPATAVSNTNQAMAKYYDDNCNAYAKYWVQQLAPCKYSQAALDEIIPKLVQVCKEGSDQSHPYGASSVKPTSSYTYRSFQQVLEEYNRLHGITDPLNCNSEMITSPMPYDRQPVYGNRITYNGPDDCECKQLAVLKEQYEINKTTADNSFSQYLLRTRGIKISEIVLQDLLTACARTDKSTCNYNNKPLQIPAFMQCGYAPPCVGCRVVSDTYQSFKVIYPGVIPVLTESDTVQQRKNQLFANYMNNRLGFSKQSWEYLIFMDSCSRQPTWDSTVCRSVFNFSNNNGSDVISYMERTTDNGYIMVGSTTGNSKGGRDAYVIKTDNKGNLSWAKTYGGAKDDWFTRIKQTSDGGYIAIGGTKSGAHNMDVLIIKMNGNGDVTWSKNIGFGTSNGEECRDIIQTSDGGYAFSGNYDIAPSTGDFLVGALDANGNPRWIKRMGTATSDQAYTLLQNNDTLVVTAITFTGGQSVYDGIILKMNRNTGAVTSANRYNIGGRKTTINGIFKTSSGYRVAILNGSGLADINANNVIMDVDYGGGVISAKNLERPSGSDIMWWQPVDTTGGGGMIIAQGVRNTPQQQLSLHKIRSDNTVAWSNRFTMPGNMEIQCLRSNPDGSFAGAGIYNNRAMLILANDSGKAGCNNSSITTGYTDIAYTQSGFSLFRDETLTNTAADFAAVGVSCTPGLMDSDCPSQVGTNCKSYGKGPLLCDNINAVFEEVDVNQINNCSDNDFFAVSKGTELYNAYRDSLLTGFERDYINRSLLAGSLEMFTVAYTLNEYHYTLYYYDQAGNLKRTVPPAGVVVDRTSTWLNRVKAARKAGTLLTPLHTMVSSYNYNTLNQVVSQQTPDAGISRFWYDRLGRLTVSQNARQQPLNKYSYTLYDAIGRITEVGEIENTTVMTDVISRDDQSLSSWVFNSRSKKAQVTVTTYDQPYFALSPVMSAVNLRNRVAWTALYNTGSDIDWGNFSTAGFYSYDVHGNVDTLVQDYKLGGMAAANNRFKKLVYNYDLISGKINRFAYQPGETDAFYQRYEYDAENRLTNVYTSHDSLYWENDAFYQYYKHGPLARAIIGQQQVQGIDYVYTLQGWLKAVNPTVGVNAGDGSTGSPVAADAYSFLLQYNNSDYSGINGNSPGSLIPVQLRSEHRPLYNGNISSMGVNIRKLNSPILYNYQYDQLNRLVKAEAWKTVKDDWSSLQKISDLREMVSYDPMGNILSTHRRGNTLSGQPLEMDSLVYHYQQGTNRLDYVSDAAPATNYANDIDDQTSGNYGYDATGNLISDRQSGIGNIAWNVYGKIQSISKSDGTTLSYTYDVSGNRISKTVSSGGKVVSTWYVRDAQGNVVSVYSNGDASLNGGNLTQVETHLYGSSRLGMSTLKRNVQNISAPVTLDMPGLGTGKSINFIRGNKFFELNNHLGNVLTVLSDKKLPRPTSDGKNVSFYVPDITSAQDYYSFGMWEPGRGLSGNEKYRYGFNGKENDNEVKGEGNQQDYGMRVYDPRIGKFLSVDPLSPKYPWYTPYQFAGNTPIQAIDLDGAEEWMMHQAFATKRTAEIKILRQDQIARDKLRILMQIPEPHIMMKIDGVIQMGPQSIVLRNATIAQERYNEALGDAIRGGIGGSAGYLMSGDKGAFLGAGVDGVAMSLAGIPAGNSSVFPQASEIGSARFTPYTGTRANRFFGKLDPLVRTAAEAIEGSMPNSVLAVEREIKDLKTGRTLTDFDIELNNYIIEVNDGSAKGKLTQIRDRIQPHTNKEVILFSPKMSGSVEKSMKANNIRAFRDLKSLIEYVTPKQK